MNEFTIGRYLETDDEYDACFWATYTFDFSVATFLIKKYLRPILEGGGCHIISDFNRVGTKQTNISDLEAFLKLQNKVILSMSHKEGAFHPKIIILIGQSQTRLILSSGNTTTEGILSNVDLVAEYDWRSDQKKPDQTAKVAQQLTAEAFRFLRSQNGWNQFSIQEFNKSIEKHPWLESLSTREFLSTEKGTLLKQIANNLGTSKVSEIEIYSPFYDEDLLVLKNINRKYPKALLKAFVVDEPLPISSQISLKELKRNGILLRSSKDLSKAHFHAKVYRFVVGKNKSIVFWGSANCTKAALLLDNYNSEYLIQTEMDNKQFEKIFQPNTAKKDTEAVTIEALEKELKDWKLLDIKVRLLSANIIGTNLELKYEAISDDKSYRIEAKGLDKIKYFEVDRSSKGLCNVNIEKYGFRPLVLRALDEKDAQISNNIYVQCPELVFGQSDEVEEELIRRRVEKVDVVALSEIDRYFTFSRNPNVVTLIRHSTGGQKDAKSWNVPIYNRSYSWSSGYSFRIPLVNPREITENEDENYDTTEDEDKEIEEINHRKVRREGNQRLFIIAHKKMIRHYERLILGIDNEVTPIAERWASGIEHHVKLVLRDLEKQNYKFDEEDELAVSEYFGASADMAVYFTFQHSIKEDELSDDTVISRICDYSKAIYLHCYLSQYQLLINLQACFKEQLKREQPDLFFEIDKSRYLLAAFHSIFGIVCKRHKKECEHGIDVVLPSLRNRKLAEEALTEFKKLDPVFSTNHPLKLNQLKEGLAFNNPSFGPCFIIKNSVADKKVELGLTLGRKKVLYYNDSWVSKN